MVQFNKSKIAAIRHVITPNLSFNYTPDFSDEKYGYYKTVQTDSIGNTQQYSIMNNGVYGSPSTGKSGNIFVRNFATNNFFFNCLHLLVFQWCYVFPMPENY